MKPVVTFFNNKGGVGKTSLVYHTAWMLAEQGRRVVVVDLDPQANLTSAFLSEDALESILEDHAALTVFDSVVPLLKVGDLRDATPIPISENLHLVAGALELAKFEDPLAEQWGKCLGSGELYRPFRMTTAFATIAQRAAAQVGAELVLFDVGPNLGALNRAALLSTDYVVVPLAADLFSIQGLRNLGPTLETWRADWATRRQRYVKPDFALPAGGMKPVGYVVQQADVRLGRPVKAHTRWLDRVPAEYRKARLSASAEPESTDADPECLASMKHYRSLVAMAQEAHKPVFLLRPGDGALGGHGAAVAAAYADFKQFVERLLLRIGC